MLKRDHETEAETDATHESQSSGRKSEGADCYLGTAAGGKVASHERLVTVDIRGSLFDHPIGTERFVDPAE